MESTAYLTSELFIDLAPDSTRAKFNVFAGFCSGVHPPGTPDYLDVDFQGAASIEIWSRPAVTRAFLPEPATCAFRKSTRLQWHKCGPSGCEVRLLRSRTADDRKRVRVPLRRSEKKCVLSVCFRFAAERVRKVSSGGCFLKPTASSAGVRSVHVQNSSFSMSKTWTSFILMTSVELREEVKLLGIAKPFSNCVALATKNAQKGCSVSSRFYLKNFKV